MGPPKVSVSKKQPLEDVEALLEACKDRSSATSEGDRIFELSNTDQSVRETLRKPQKVDSKPFTSALYNVEVGSPCPTNAANASIRQVACRKAFIIALSVILLTVIICGTVITVLVILNHERQAPDRDSTWEGEVTQDGYSATESIMVDDNKQIIEVSRHPDGYFTELNIVFDYRIQLAVYKDETNRKCYLKHPLLEIYADGKRRWKAYQYAARSPQPFQVREPVIPAMLRPEVSVPCEGYATFIVTDLSSSPPAPGMTDLPFSPPSGPTADYEAGDMGGQDDGFDGPDGGMNYPPGGMGHPHGGMGHPHGEMGDSDGGMGDSDGGMGDSDGGMGDSDGGMGDSDDGMGNPDGYTSDAPSRDGPSPPDGVSDQEYADESPEVVYL